MSDNGWPGKPGVPLNPERDGWHWVQRVDKGFVPSPRIVLWTDDWASGQFSWDAIGYESASEQKFGRDFCYISPALTPAEVDACIATARKDALEEAADLCDQLSEHTPGICAIAIREMADPILFSAEMVRADERKDSL